MVGRELAGVVAEVSGEGKWQVGDRVSELIVGLGPWLMSAFGRLLLCLRIIGTCARQPLRSGGLPGHVSFKSGLAFTVAFAAASIALGVSLGLDFSSVLDGPDLY